MTSLEDTLRRALAGRYTVERELGRGGMATVFLATDLRHHRPVALKVLRPELASTVVADRFAQEIAILARLTHPHILPLHEADVADGALFYVMPFVDGETLRHRLDREGPLPEGDALRIAGQIADALAYAHGLGVVHRDIKPENVLFESGHAVVADFGIARAVSAAGTARLTETGWALGTPAYMSPEQAAGESDAGARTDIYALGAVLYEMLAGSPPHTGSTPQAILARTLTEPVPPISGVREGLNPAIEPVLTRALARRPEDRYPTAASFRDAITNLSQRPITAGRPPPARRRPILLGAGLAVLLGLAFALRGLFGGGHGDTRPPALALFPFQAGPAAAEWSEQVPDLLATFLDGTPGLRVVDPWALWGRLRPAPGDRARSPGDLAEAERLARGAHAGMVLLGSLHVDTAAAAGPSLSVTIRIFEVGGSDAVETLTSTASRDSVAGLVRRLAVELMTRLQPGRRYAGEFDGFVSSSPEAVRAYLAAKEAMRRGQVDQAEATIDSALAADSTFALGYLEATTIKSWAQSMRGRGFFGLTDLLARAERHAGPMSARNKARLESLSASVRTDGPAAALAARRILAQDSSDLEAWQSLGYFHLVYGWQYGADEQDAVAAYRRVEALDSLHIPALTSMLWIQTMAGDAEATATAMRLRRIDTLSPLARGALLSYRAVTAADSAFDGLVDTLALSDPVLVLPVLRSLRSARPDRAGELLDRLRRRQGPGIPDYRNEWARLLTAQGRYRTVDSIARAGGFGPAPTADWLLVNAALTGVGDSTIAAGAAARLDRLLPIDSALHKSDDHPVWITGWMLGAWNATYGDSAITRRWQAVIAALPAGGTSPDYRGALRADLEARLLAGGGSLDAALTAADSAYARWGIHTENVAEVQPEPQLRFHGAMLLIANGREDSAAAILRSLVPPVSWKGFLTARASLELGRIFEAANKRNEAARHYTTAVRLWRNADSSVTRWGTVAREGLLRTTGEPPGA